MVKNRYTKKVLVLIFSLSILRLAVGSVVELSNDESYYWLYSQVLKWNYFDHPPLVAVWIRIFTANLLLEKHVIFLRLGSIAGCAMATWFMYKCVTALSSERAGWFAACFYNASFYAGITAGLFIFPDAPQMVFYTFSLWMIAKITQDDKKWLYWILFGIASGLCIMSKVHGVFIWVGMGAFILLKKRNWLANPRMYVALLFALIITSPILIWNIQNDFVTYRFNSSRIVIKGFALNPLSFFAEVCGQFLINNPFNVMFIIISLFAWRRFKYNYLPALTIYNLIGLPLIFILIFISLYRNTLPHWSGPAYVALIPLAAIRLAELKKELFYPKLIFLSVGGYIIFMVICPLLINHYPGNFGSKQTTDLGKGDITIDMYGWSEAGKGFDSLYKTETSNGIMPENTPLVCNKWWGAHAEYYFCKPLGIQMIGLGEMNELHEYMWMNKLRKDKVNISSAYCIINSDDYYDVHAQYDNYYSRIDTVKVIKMVRGKLPSHNFYIYRLTGWKNKIPYVE